MSITTSTAGTTKVASSGGSSSSSSAMFTGSAERLAARGEIRSFPSRSEGAHAARNVNASNNVK